MLTKTSPRYNPQLKDLQAEPLQITGFSPKQASVKSPRVAEAGRTGPSQKLVVVGKSRQEVTTPITADLSKQSSMAESPTVRVPRAINEQIAGQPHFVQHRPSLKISTVEPKPASRGNSKNVIYQNYKNNKDFATANLRITTAGPATYIIVDKIDPIKKKESPLKAMTNAKETKVRLSGIVETEASPSHKDKLDKLQTTEGGIREQASIEDGEVQQLQGSLSSIASSIKKQNKFTRPAGSSESPMTFATEEASVLRLNQQFSSVQKLKKQQTLAQNTHQAFQSFDHKLRNLSKSKIKIERKKNLDLVDEAAYIDKGFELQLQSMIKLEQQLGPGGKIDPEVVSSVINFRSLDPKFTDEEERPPGDKSDYRQIRSIQASIISNKYVEEESSHASVTKPGFKSRKVLRQKAKVNQEQKPTTTLDLKKFKEKKDMNKQALAARDKLVRELEEIDQQVKNLEIVFKNNKDLIRQIDVAIRAQKDNQILVQKQKQINSQASSTIDSTDLINVHKQELYNELLLSQTKNLQIQQKLRQRADLKMQLLEHLLKHPTHAQQCFSPVNGDRLSFKKEFSFRASASQDSMTKRGSEGTKKLETSRFAKYTARREEMDEIDKLKLQLSTRLRTNRRRVVIPTRRGDETYNETVIPASSKRSPERSVLSPVKNMSIEESDYIFEAMKPSAHHESLSVESEAGHNQSLGLTSRSVESVQQPMPDLYKQSAVTVKSPTKFTYQKQAKISKLNEDGEIREEVLGQRVKDTMMVLNQAHLVARDIQLDQFYKQRNHARTSSYIHHLETKLGGKIQTLQSEYYKHRQQLLKRGILFKEDLPEFHETALLSKQKYLQKDIANLPINQIVLSEEVASMDSALAKLPHPSKQQIVRQKIEQEYDQRRRMKELRLQNADTPSWSEEEIHHFQPQANSPRISVNQQTQEIKAANENEGAENDFQDYTDEQIYLKNQDSWLSSDHPHSQQSKELGCRTGYDLSVEKLPKAQGALTITSRESQIPPVPSKNQQVGKDSVGATERSHRSKTLIDRANLRFQNILQFSKEPVKVADVQNQGKNVRLQELRAKFESLKTTLASQQAVVEQIKSQSNAQSVIGSSQMGGLVKDEIPSLFPVEGFRSIVVTEGDLDEGKLFSTAVPDGLRDLKESIIKNAEQSQDKPVASQRFMSRRQTTQGGSRPRPLPNFSSIQTQREQLFTAAHTNRTNKLQDIQLTARNSPQKSDISKFWVKKSVDIQTSRAVSLTKRLTARSQKSQTVSYPNKPAQGKDHEYLEYLSCQRSVLPALQDQVSSANQQNKEVEGVFGSKTLQDPGMLDLATLFRNMDRKVDFNNLQNKKKDHLLNKRHSQIVSRKQNQNVHALVNGFSVKSLSGVNPHYLPLSKKGDKQPSGTQVVGKAILKIPRTQEPSNSEENSPVRMVSQGMQVKKVTGVTGLSKVPSRDIQLHLPGNSNINYDLASIRQQDSQHSSVGPQFKTLDFQMQESEPQSAAQNILAQNNQYKNQLGAVSLIKQAERREEREIEATEQQLMQELIEVSGSNEVTKSAVTSQRDYLNQVNLNIQAKELDVVSGGNEKLKPKGLTSRAHLDQEQRTALREKSIDILKDESECKTQAQAAVTDTTFDEANQDASFNSKLRPTLALNSPQIKMHHFSLIPPELSYNLSPNQQVSTTHQQKQLTNIKDLLAQVQLNMGKLHKADQYKKDLVRIEHSNQGEERRELKVKGHLIDFLPTDRVRLLEEVTQYKIRPRKEESLRILGDDLNPKKLRELAAKEKALHKGKEQELKEFLSLNA